MARRRGPRIRAGGTPCRDGIAGIVSENGGGMKIRPMRRVGGAAAGWGRAPPQASVRSWGCPATGDPATDPATRPGTLRRGPGRRRRPGRHDRVRPGSNLQGSAWMQGGRTGECEAAWSSPGSAREQCAGTFSSGLRGGRALPGRVSIHGLPRSGCRDEAGDGPVSRLRRRADRGGPRSPWPALPRSRQRPGAVPSRRLPRAGLALRGHRAGSFRRSP